jgi:hypothetical protein
MKQTRGTSLLKSIVSTAVGFGIAMVANAVVLPFFGYSPTLSENLLLTTIYTVISIARGYLLERLFEALGWRMRMSPFALAVLAERQRQTTHEGFSAHDDDELLAGELATAGACYAICAGDAQREPPEIWPWSLSWWKPTGFRRDLVKAGALILAEGERGDRNRKVTRVETKPREAAGTIVAVRPAAWRGHLAHGKSASEQGGASA